MCLATLLATHYRDEPHRMTLKNEHSKKHSNLLKWKKSTFCADLIIPPVNFFKAKSEFVSSFQGNATGSGTRLQCGVCHRTFGTSYNLKRHSVVHTKEKPYACEFCDGRYTQSSYLKCHMLRFHPESVSPDKWNVTVMNLIVRLSRMSVAKTIVICTNEKKSTFYLDLVKTSSDIFWL